MPFLVALTGRNSVMDWGLWIVLIILTTIVLWLYFRPKK